MATGVSPRKQPRVAVKSCVVGRPHPSCLPEEKVKKRGSVWWVIGFLAFGIGPNTACKKEEVQKPAEASLTTDLEIWPGGQPVRLKKSSPVLPLGSGGMALLPTLDGATWETTTVSSTASFHHVRTSGKAHGQAIQTTWMLAQGNPQMKFVFAMTNAPRDLVEPIALEFKLPPGVVRYADLNQRMTAFEGEAVSLPPAAPRWIEWKNDDQTLVFSQWQGDGFEIQSTTDGFTLRLVVFDPARRAAVGCVPDPAPRLESQLLVTFGADQPIFASRLANGLQSAIVPVFAEKQGRYAVDGSSRTPEELAARIRTLALGHSDTEDPRHGNGGLVGTNLGGTFLIPADVKTHPDLVSLAESLKNTTVELSVSDNSPTAMSSCDQPVEVLRRVLEPGEVWNGNYRNEVGAIPGANHGWPARWVVPALDGARETLTGQVFTRPYMDQTLRDRAVLVFLAPLVATRNPLVEAYQNTLLMPERNGQWTIAPEIDRVFGELELNQEMSEHAVLSAENLIRDMHAAWGTRIERRADGSWRLLGTMDGITLILPDAHEVTVEATEADVQIVDGQSQPQTWVSFDLKGSAIVRIKDVTPLPAVAWTFESDTTP